MGWPPSVGLTLYFYPCDLHWGCDQRHSQSEITTDLAQPPDIAALASLEYARAVVTAHAKRPCRIAARATAALLGEQTALVRLMWQELLRGTG
jgi:hypothetical protein